MNLLKTILPNQLVNPANFINSTTVNGVTFTIDKVNGIITVTGTATSDTTVTIETVTSKITNGNKYILWGCPSGGSGSTFRLHISTNNSTLVDYGSGGIYAFNNTTVAYLGIRVFNGVTINKTFRPQLVDLTLLYGQGLEPSTVAQFRADYPLDYYPYSLTNTTGLLTCANGAVTADISSMLPSDIGCFDLGTIPTSGWTNNGNNRYSFNAKTYIPDIYETSEGFSHIPSIIASQYSTTNRTSLPNLNKAISYHWGNDGWYINIRNTDASSASQLVNLLQGVLLFYKKA